MVINYLDLFWVELIILNLPSEHQSNFEAHAAIIAEFGSKVYIATKKNAFIRILIKKDENIEELANYIYYDAQILMGYGALLTYNAKTTLNMHQILSLL